MPEQDELGPTRFYEGVAPDAKPFHIKGAHAQGWGMQNRLSRIFQADAKTVMLAIDHGYFQGPTTGLERIDLTIPQLLPSVDALMCTRGILRTSIPPNSDLPVVVRASGGPSVLQDLSDERLAMTMTDAVRINASAVAVQMFIGSERETQSVRNLTTLVDEGLNAGIPVLGVVAVGKDMARDARYYRLATRIGAELGAQIIKCYYTEEDFGTVVASCPVPLVVAGGKKIPERDALEMAYRAISEGAAGLDMGRNIFQSENPAGMVAAIDAIVHRGYTAADAYELYQDVDVAVSV